MRFPALITLAALAASTVALAQQAPPPSEPPPSTTQPPPSTEPQDQSTDPATTPSDPDASPNSNSRQDTLRRECLTQVTAANPGVPADDIKNFCDKEVNQATQPHG